MSHLENNKVTDQTQQQQSDRASAVDMADPQSVRAVFQQRSRGGEQTSLSQLEMTNPYTSPGDGCHKHHRNADSRDNSSSDGNQFDRDLNRFEADLKQLTSDLDRLLRGSASPDSTGDRSTQNTNIATDYTGSQNQTQNQGADNTATQQTQTDQTQNQNQAVDNTNQQTQNQTQNQATDYNQGFQADGGKLTVNGQVLAGVNVTSDYIDQTGAAQAAANIKNELPGINSIRLMTSPDGGAYSQDGNAGHESVQDIVNIVKAFNDQGMGVIIDNHAADANNQNSVAAAGNEASWFGQLAQAELGNKQVMFQSLNEPMGSNQDIAAEQKAVYDAVRATGSTNVVAFDEAGGGYAGPMTDNASMYASMNNIAFDAHSYAGTASGDQAVQSYQSEVAQTAAMTQAGGKPIAVFDGEIGNTMGGENDPGFNQLGSYVSSSGMGAEYFTYSGGMGPGSTGDNMINADGTLNSYGQQVAQWIAQANQSNA